MTEQPKQKIPPTTESIRSEINREDMTWEKAIGDMLDNSLDAQATRVIVKIDKAARRVHVIDNGEGCPEPHRMLQSGYTTKRNKKNMLGRYGVGLKHASFFFCGESGSTTILTSHGGTHQMARVCWGDVLKCGEWEIDAVCSVADNEAIHTLPELKGTSVQFAPVKAAGRGFQSSDALDAMLTAFEFVFSPALRSGRQIEFHVGDRRPRVLAASRDPAWSESMEFEVAIDHRKARVRAGIKASNDKSKRSGMSFCYGHRVIIRDSADGLGDYSREGFSGLVDLDDSWVLGVNKTSVTDDAWERLLDAILERIRPLLEKLKKSTLIMQCEAIRAGVSEMLGGVLAEVMGGKRKQPSGWHRKKGGPPRNAKDGNGNGGDEMRKARRGGRFHIDLYTDHEDPRGGYTDESSLRVYLNQAKPAIAEAVASGDQVFVACAAWAFWCNAESQGLLPGMRERSFDVAMGEFFSKPSTMTRAVAEAVAS